MIVQTIFISYRKPVNIKRHGHKTNIKQNDNNKISSYVVQHFPFFLPFVYFCFSFLFRVET